MPGQAEIHEKSVSKQLRDRQNAIELLETHFPNLPNKDQAWQDLHRLTQDKDRYVRGRSADVLGKVFSQIPDNSKGEAWQDLIRLTQDQDGYIRWGAADVLGTAFSQIPDNSKGEAWQDFHKLTHDQDSEVLLRAAYALGTTFSHVPYKSKDQAWRALLLLTKDPDSNVRLRATFALETAFSYLPDSSKEEAWRDLLRLTQNHDSYVRWRAAYALGTGFSHLPDKSKDRAEQDLLRLTQNRDSDVQRSAASALGTVFGQLSDNSKNQAWQDLIRLTLDQNRSVLRMNAYHSLGKISVLKAAEAQSKNGLRKHLEDAVGYFEKSAQESKYSPANFCRLFYRSYFAITFMEAPQETVQKYLNEAKEAVGGSKSKEELLNAVENLAKALEEVQRLKDRPLQEVLRDLKTYEWYCAQAAEHMASAQDKAPGAVKLLKNCNPLIRENIQSTIAEIQDIARQICQMTHDKGPEVDAFGGQIKEAAGSLSGEDLIETLRSIFDFASILRDKCELLSEDERGLVESQLDIIDYEGAIPRKLDAIKTVVKFFLFRIQKDEDFIRRLGEMDGKIDAIHQDMMSLRQSLLDRFDLSEQEILSSIFERLDKDKLEIIRALLDAVQENRIPKELIDETLSATRDLITEIRLKDIEIQDEELDSWEEAINSPELIVENRILVTIPIIPFLLTYEGSYNFQAGMRLDAAWRSLRALVRR